MQAKFCNLNVLFQFWHDFYDRDFCVRRLLKLFIMWTLVLLLDYLVSLIKRLKAHYFMAVFTGYVNTNLSLPSHMLFLSFWRFRAHSHHLNETLKKRKRNLVYHILSYVLNKSISIHFNLFFFIMVIVQ